jgi:ribonuclease HIII
VKVKKDQIPEIKEALLEANAVTELKPTNPYEAFRLKYGNEIIVAYTSGKVVSSGDLSAKILSSAIVHTTTEETDQTVVGSDEDGKGEWLGPLVVASVVVSPNERKTLVSKGVMDSKLLSLTAIRSTATFIKKTATDFKIVTVPPVRFNELMMDVKDEGKSLNDLLAWAHSRAIEGVTKKLLKEPKRVRIVIDEFDKLKTETRLGRVINREDFEIIQHPKAEEEVAVAAASILARDEREFWIDKQSNVVHKDLRTVNPSQALADPFAFSFAKIAYLKQGNSQAELLNAKVLQNALAVEYELKILAESLASKNKVADITQLRSMSDYAKFLQQQNLVTNQFVNQVNELARIRNNAAHMGVTSQMELEQAVGLSATLARSLRNMVERLKQPKLET